MRIRFAIKQGQATEHANVKAIWPKFRHPSVLQYTDVHDGHVYEVKVKDVQDILHEGTTYGSALNLTIAERKRLEELNNADEGSLTSVERDEWKTLTQKFREGK